MTTEFADTINAAAAETPTMHPSYTLAVIKPDAYCKGYLGPIIGRIQDAGFAIMGMHLSTWDRGMVEDFYRAHRDRPFFNDLVAFTTSGPCVSLILCLPKSDTDEDAVTQWRMMMGATDPKKAPVGTIRRVFGATADGSPMMHNAVHGSDSANAAHNEIKLIASVSQHTFSPFALDASWRARRT